MLGLTLAIIGLYGLVAYSVARRTKEIGIRMAIGAGSGDVLRMVLVQGLTLALVGIAFGGVASAGIARLLSAGLTGLGRPASSPTRSSRRSSSDSRCWRAMSRRGARRRSTRSSH